MGWFRGITSCVARSAVPRVAAAPAWRRGGWRSRSARRKTPGQDRGADRRQTWWRRFCSVYGAARGRHARSYTPTERPQQGGGAPEPCCARMKGLVGLVASEANPIKPVGRAAENHPAFSYRAETGEEIYHSFLGVPVLRAGNNARRAGGAEPGAAHLHRGGRRRRCRRPRWWLAEDDRLGRALGPSPSRAPSRPPRRQLHLTGTALNDGIGARPRGGCTSLASSSTNFIADDVAERN